MPPTLSANDEGKVVVDSNGDRLGVVTAVDDGVASIDPSREVSLTVGLALGWNVAEGRYCVYEPSIETITDSAIHLRGNL